MENTIAHLADRWRGARALLPAFAMLAEGMPLAVSRLASKTGTPEDELGATLDAVRCERDAEGRLIDIFGMTLSPTAIELTFSGKRVFACCALWAHVIPRLVGQTAKVRSTDPVSGQSVLLSISPDVVGAVTPHDASATLSVATQREVELDVGAAFCSHVRHFSSRRSAEQFARLETRRHVVGVEGLHQASRRFFSAIWRGMPDTKSGQHSARRGGGEVG